MVKNVIEKQLGVEEYNKPENKPVNNPNPAPKKDDDNTRRDGDNSKSNGK